MSWFGGLATQDTLSSVVLTIQNLWQNTNLQLVQTFENEIFPHVDMATYLSIFWV